MQMHRKWSTMWSHLDIRLDNTVKANTGWFSLLLWRSQFYRNCKLIVENKCTGIGTFPTFGSSHSSSPSLPTWCKNCLLTKPMCTVIKSHHTSFLPHLKQDTWHRHTSFAKTPRKELSASSRWKRKMTLVRYGIFLYIFMMHLQLCLKCKFNSLLNSKNFSKFRENLKFGRTVNKSI